MAKMSGRIFQPPKAYGTITMARQTRPRPASTPVEQHRHWSTQCVNGSQVRLVTPDKDPGTSKNREHESGAYLGPPLRWAGKAERTSPEVSAVGLLVHERIDSKASLEQVRNYPNGGQGWWSNPLVAGDSLLAMNSSLRKESMVGRVRIVQRVQKIHSDLPFMLGEPQRITVDIADGRGIESLNAMEISNVS